MPNFLIVFLPLCNLILRSTIALTRANELFLTPVDVDAVDGVLVLASEDDGGASRACIAIGVIRFVAGLSFLMLDADDLLLSTRSWR